MGSFTLKNGMRIHTYGEYDKDGWKVPNPSALPWEKNNFKGAFELKSANGAFDIRIEGAHEGVGLGHDFLRHVERTKVLLHVLDVSGTDGRDPIEDFEKINFELSQYSERLGRRKQLVVANKMDLPEGQENFQRVKEYVEAKGYEIVKASAATGEGLQELMYKAYEMLQNFEPEPDEEENIIMDEIDPDSFEITACADADFEVKGKNIERLVAMTNFDNDEALYRFQLIWKSLGIDAALKEKGIQEGQTVRIRDMVFEFKEY